MRSVILALALLGAAVAVLPLASATQLPPYISPLPGLLWCNPDFAGACAHSGDDWACAGVNFGLQGAAVCAEADPLTVRVCSSMYISDVGNCPLDVLGGIIVTD